MICLRCGVEAEDDAQICWKCQHPFDDVERSLALYPVTYEESGMQLNPLGLVMFTKDRLIFYKITDEMVKEEKKKVKGLLTKWEKAMAQLMDKNRFLAMSPVDFLANGPENFALANSDIKGLVYKRSYFNNNRWATGNIAGWRGGCLTITWENQSLRLRTEISGERPKEERAAISLFERIFGDRFEAVD